MRFLSAIEWWSRSLTHSSLDSIWTRTVNPITNHTSCPILNSNIPWIISLDIICTRIIFLHAQPQVVNNNCVKFDRYQIICLGGVTLTRLCGQTWGCTGWFLYTPKNYVCYSMGIKRFGLHVCVKVFNLYISPLFSDYCLFDSVPLTFLSCIQDIRYRFNCRFWYDKSTSHNMMCTSFFNFLFRI